MFNTGNTFNGPQLCTNYFVLDHARELLTVVLHHVIFFKAYVRVQVRMVRAGQVLENHFAPLSFGLFVAADGAIVALAVIQFINEVALSIVSP